MNISSILNIAKRELKFIFTTKSRIILLFAVPFVTYFFITFIYSNQVIHNIPIAIYDADNTELTRAITRFADASASMEVVYRASSVDELNELILNGDIEGAFYFPSNMTADIKRGGDSKVNIIISSRNIVFGNLLYKAASEVVITVSSAILLKKFGADGMPIVQSMNLVMPFRMHKKALYNPNYNYMQYLAPGLLTVLFQMIIMFAGTSAINIEFNEKKSNKGIFELLGMAKNKILNIILGKALAYVVVAIFPALLILLVVFPFMGIIIYGNIFILFFYLIYFAFVSVSLGLMLSSILLENAIALDIAFVYNSPAFVFSGFTFPAWALPIYDQYYAQIIPYTQFIVGFLKLYQMNTPIQFIFSNLFILTIFLFVGILGSYIALRFQIKKINSKAIA
jgi:ABC-2 type transport system permease protein